MKNVIYYFTFSLEGPDGVIDTTTANTNAHDVAAIQERLLERVGGQVTLTKNWEADNSLLQGLDRKYTTVVYYHDRYDIIEAKYLGPQRAVQDLFAMSQPGRAESLQEQELFNAQVTHLLSEMDRVDCLR